MNSHSRIILVAALFLLGLGTVFLSCSDDDASPTAVTTKPLSCAMTPGGQTAGAAPFQVAFAATASGGSTPYTYAWSFGDGASSSGASPSHVYEQSGTYNATLVVRDSKGATCNEVCVITVTSSAGLNCAASATPTSGNVPVSVSFTGSASGGSAPYSYAWTFGDGASSSAQNPSHVYQNAGSYTARLTVTDAQSTTCQKTVTINLTSPVVLTCAASATPTSGTAPLAVSFTGSASGGSAPYNYTWTFGDGTTSSAQSPSHTYQNAGSYTARLTVTDAQSATCQKTVAITVTAPSVPTLTGPGSVPSGQSFILSWTFAWPPLASSNDKVSIERSTTSSGSGFVEIGQVLRSSGSQFGIVNPPVGTHYYRVRAYYSAGGSPQWSGYSNVVTVTVTAVVSKTRFNNNSTYLMVSLKIDGVEQFTASPQGLLPGHYLEKELAPGNHSYDAMYGFWNEYGGRETMYRFYGSYTQRSGMTETINFTSPTIAQLMTKFQNSGLWEGWVPGSLDRLGIRFYANGTFIAYRNNVQYGSGSYTYVSRDTYAWSVQFRIGTSNAVFYELLDWFAAPSNDPVQYFYEGQ